MRLKQNARSERGAQLIEFALVMPLLLLLLLGIVELGYVLGQRNDVRHGAHEGARLAAVDDANLGDNTCNSMTLIGEPTIDFTDSPNGKTGEQGSVTVSVDVASLSGLGLIEIFLPDQLTTTAQFKLEQDSENWDDALEDRSPGGTPCP